MYPMIITAAGYLKKLTERFWECGLGFNVIAVNERTGTPRLEEPPHMAYVVLD